MRKAIMMFVAVLTLGCIVSGEVSPYQESIATWRQRYEEVLKGGWLTVSGLFWLHEGENRFGSDPLNDIVLPAPAPAMAGAFEYHPGKTVVVHSSPGSPFMLNGKTADGAELRPDSQDRVTGGDLTLGVHMSGERYAIRMFDKNSKLAKDFTGSQWYPIDESYRVTAHYVPYDSPRKIEITNILGDTERTTVAGYVTFSLHGQDYRLDAETTRGGRLFIVFRDLTSGKETYPAARFIETDVPKDGSVELDFNKAHNPPCAYNPYTTCPLPSPGNRLRVEIPAGEKTYKHN
jgi:uncharacterized protein (DUF1684 family)